MYDLMIVDDDRMVISDLVNLIDWEKAGFNIACVAGNGKAALDKYRRYRPDVVITDVVMPVMKGIELLARIKAISPGAIVILISSFAEFSYAKEAIELGALGYLLKDEICEEHLMPLLAKAKDQLETASATENPFSRWPAETKRPAAAAGSLPLAAPALPRAYCYLVCELDAPEQLARIMGCKEIDECRFTPEEIRFFRDSRKARYHVHNLFALTGGRLAMELSPQTGSHPSAHPEELADFGRSLGRSFKERYHRTVSFFLVPGLHNAESVRGVYKHYENNIPNRFLVGSELVISIADPRLKCNTALPAVNAIELAMLLREGDRDQILQRFKSFLDDATLLRDFYGMIDALQAIFYVITCYLREAGLDEMGTASGSGLVQQLKDIDHFRQWLNSEISQLIAKRSEMTGYSRPVIKAVRYIRANYKEADLSIADVAEHVSLSKTHLGYLFKKEVGMTINCFIIHIRISNAMIMLRTSDQMIYEVAQTVGYRSSQYFSQVFLNNVGCSPKQYRLQSARV